MHGKPCALTCNSQESLLNLWHQSQSTQRKQANQPGVFITPSICQPDKNVLKAVIYTHRCKICVNAVSVLHSNALLCRWGLDATFATPASQALKGRFGFPTSLTQSMSLHYMPLRHYSSAHVIAVMQTVADRATVVLGKRAVKMCAELTRCCNFIWIEPARERWPLLSQWHCCCRLFAFWYHVLNV